MNTTVLYAELLVVGSGAAISILVFFYSFFGDKSWFSDIKELSTIGGLVSLIPVLSVIYLLGIINSNIGHVLFKPFLKEFKPEISKDDYKKIRHHLYISNFEKLKEDFEFRQSKIRICRGWFINSSLIAVAFWICLQQEKIELSKARFFIITAGVLVILTIISWAVTMKTQLDLLREYKRSNMTNQESN